jgi:carbonic anhydrase
MNTKNLCSHFLTPVSRSTEQGGRVVTAALIVCLALVGTGCQTLGGTMLTAPTPGIDSPEAALAELKAGNARFVSKTMLNRDLSAQVEATSGGQTPFAVVLGCIDSRVPPELVFDQGIGDIFSPRIAGNFANTDILGSMEFATAVAGSKLIVVLGHTACGAIQGATDSVELGNLTSMLDSLEPAVAAVEGAGERSSKNTAFVQAAAEKNVALTVESIRTNSPTIAALEADGKVALIGAMYDVATGEVAFFE